MAQDLTAWMQMLPLDDEQDVAEPNDRDCCCPASPHASSAPADASSQPRRHLANATTDVEAIRRLRALAVPG